MLGLPDLANKNTEGQVKFEFQTNNNFFFVISMSQNNMEHTYTKDFLLFI